MLFAPVVIVLLTIVFSRPSSSPSVQVSTVTVSQGESIQAAVDQAAAGDTISVHAGVYGEQVTIDKPLTVEAFGDGEAIVDGECSRDHGFLVTNNLAGSNPVGVTLRGLTVRNTKNASVLFLAARPDSPIPARGTVDGMSLQNFDCDGSHSGQYEAGVASWYSGPGFVVTNNVIAGPYGRGTDCSDDGCANGIWFKSNDSNPSGGGHYIAGNRISDVWDGIGGEEEGSPRGTLDRNSVVENNVITSCHDDGIQSEGGNLNNVIRNNDISGCGTGVAIAPVGTGPLTVEGNYIHDLVMGDLENLFCFKVGSPSSGLARLINNRCVVNSSAEQGEGGADGIHQTDPGMSPMYLRNNVFYVSRYVYEIFEPADFDSQSNCLVPLDDDYFTEWEGTPYASLAAFQQATGLEQGSTQSEACNIPPAPTSALPAATAPAGPATTVASPTTQPLATPPPASTSEPEAPPVSPTSAPDALSLAPSSTPAAAADLLPPPTTVPIRADRDWRLEVLLPYLLSSVLCAFAGVRDLALVSREERPRRLIFWLIVGGVLAALAVFAATDAQRSIGDAFRDEAQSEGWYSIRRPIQATVVILIVVAADATILLAMRLKGAKRRYLPPFIALVFLCSFVVIRSLSLHQIDAVLFEGHLLGVSWSDPIEISATLAVGLAAVFSVLVAASRGPAAEGASGDGVSGAEAR